MLNTIRVRVSEEPSSSIRLGLGLGCALMLTLTYVAARRGGRTKGAKPPPRDSPLQEVHDLERISARAQDIRKSKYPSGLTHWNEFLVWALWDGSFSTWVNDDGEIAVIRWRSPVPSLNPDFNLGSKNC